MDWCKLSSGYYRDAALIRAGEAAEVMFLRGLAYCAEHDTGGRIDADVLPFICPKRTAARTSALVREGLWRAVDGGFVVRSWDVWQAAADVLADRRRKDNERKRAARHAQKAADVHGLSADAAPDKSADSPQMSGGESENKTETKNKSTTDVVPAATSSQRRARPLPADFGLTDGMKAWAAQNEPTVDVERETAKFIDYFRATGKSMKDWTAAWNNWIRRAAEQRPHVPQQRQLRAVGASTTDQKVADVLALSHRYEQEDSS